MTYFITAARKSGKSSVEEITAYRVTTARVNDGKVMTKEQFFKEFFHQDDSYFLYNPYNLQTVGLERKFSENREPYMRTIANGTETDNLLALPEC